MDQAGACFSQQSVCLKHARFLRRLQELVAHPLFYRFEERKKAPPAPPVPRGDFFPATAADLPYARELFEAGVGWGLFCCGTVMFCVDGDDRESYYAYGRCCCWGGEYATFVNVRLCSARTRANLTRVRLGVGHLGGDGLAVPVRA